MELLYGLEGQENSWGLKEGECFFFHFSFVYEKKERITVIPQISDMWRIEQEKIWEGQYDAGGLKSAVK